MTKIIPLRIKILLLFLLLFTVFLGWLAFSKPALERSVKHIEIPASQLDAPTGV